jgi:hypothetical protein
MLAQTSNAAPVAAKGEPGGSSPALSLIGKAGAKKPGGIAGVFSDFLSSAQKELTAKGPPKGGAGESQAVSRKRAEPSEGRRGEHGRSSGAPSSPRLRADGEGPAKVEASTAARAHAESSRAKRDLPRSAGESLDAEAVNARASDDRRKAKDKRAVVGDELAAALAAAGSAAKAPVSGSAVSARAKDSREIVDSNSPIEKKSEKASSEPKVTLLDLRRSSEARRELGSKAAAKAEEPAKEALREAKVPGSDGGREALRELVLDARGTGDASSGLQAGKAEQAAPRGQDFQSMMAERMREAWNGEIVQNAHIVLRDGDAGVIRLRLRPESLGNVKIELNLSENNIRGRIIVETDEAKSAFEKNMNELADAFKQGGFDSAKLEVSVGGGGASAGGGGGFASADSSQGGSGGPFFSERLRSAVLSPADPATSASAYARRGGSVDILA